MRGGSMRGGAMRGGSKGGVSKGGGRGTTAGSGGGLGRLLGSLTRRH
jgi:hypothetical protein